MVFTVTYEKIGTWFIVMLMSADLLKTPPENFQQTLETMVENPDAIELMRYTDMAHFTAMLIVAYGMACIIDSIIYKNAH